MSTIRRKLLIIDPQNDFHDAPTHPGMPGASLAIPGSFQSLLTLTSLIQTCGYVFDDIFVTRDEHDAYDIGHPGFWKQGDGEPVKPFTQITLQGVRDGRYVPVNPKEMSHVTKYLYVLEKYGYGPHMVWPEHCKKGTWGACVVPELATALEVWSTQTRKTVPHLYKGMNYRAESYSALGPSVRVCVAAFEEHNARKMRAWLRDADVLVVAGQASSHCVNATVRDIWEFFPVAKTVLLKDCMNYVPGFEENEKKLFQDARHGGGSVVLASQVAAAIKGEK